MRSLPETRMSTGYQNWNSRRSFFIAASGTPSLASYWASRKT